MLQLQNLLQLALVVVEPLLRLAARFGRQEDIVRGRGNVFPLEGGRGGRCSGFGFAREEG